MAEIASSIAITIFDHSLGAIVRQFGYLWNHKKNMANLEAEVKKLDGVRDDKSHSILVAERNAERIRNGVETWQNNACQIGAEAREIVEEYEENAKKRCLIGLCPNLVSQYRFSRKACKKQKEIIDAVTEANQFNRVSDRVVRRAVSTLSTEGYFTFDSRKSTLEEIMKTLNDATKNSIGLYGFGGMGKTTLAKQVASRAAEEKMFEEIVMAPVTQTLELKEIQGHIAKKLDLELEGSSVAERADRIYKRLKDKKVLVILDDLWEKLDLEKVGIPFGNKHMACKVLLTSRFQHVLSTMGTEKYFNVEALEEKEAWRLFEEKTVNVVKDPTFLSIGKEVAKRCAGLPVLIATIGASLSSRPSLSVWKDALNQLKKMNNKEMHEIVNSAMELISYKHLEKTHKQLFLLCGLIGSGVLIADLLKYTWGWDLFDEDVVTVEDARNKLSVLILDLKASCLLLDGDDEDYAEMHDVVRGVAISIAQKSQNMFSVGDDDTELNRWPKDKVLKRCTAMVFDNCRSFFCLPGRLECPMLEIFVLIGFSLDSSPTIADTFFERTRKLKVLDMSKLCFSGLPSSLSFLENLQTLCLDYCNNLEDIAIVGDLKKLQVLSFIGSNIKKLPRGVGQLSELRLFDLSRCSKLEVIPAGLLEGLSQLEELYMSRGFNRWEARECLGSSETSNVRLSELNYLPNLRCLEIDVPDAKLLSVDLNFEKLERYSINVGDMSAEDNEMKLDDKGISRKVGLQHSTTGVNYLQHGLKSLLKRTEYLSVHELKGIKYVIHELDRDGFPELKHLHIQSNHEIQYIVNVEAKQDRAFAALQSLHLSDLLKLEKICNSLLTEGSFCKLTSLTVKSCGNLKYLFTPSVAMGLVEVQQLTVKSCVMMKEIIAREEEETALDTLVFPQLSYLRLANLPNLTTFYSGVEEMDSNDNIHAATHSLFNEKVNIPSLKRLRIINLDKINSIWHSQLHEDGSFCKLEVVEVVNCANLLKIFPLTMLTKIQSLNILGINGCDALEEVFEVPKGLNLEEISSDVTPILQLSELYLFCLPKLRCVWTNGLHEILSFQNLCYVTVHGCEGLKHVFPASVARCLHQLEDLRIVNCRGVQTIVDDDEYKGIVDVSASFMFSKLSKLRLDRLPELECFYPRKHTREWPALKELDVSDCDKVSALDFLNLSEKGDNLFEKLFCNLEFLSIGSKDMEMIMRQDGRFLQELFRNLKGSKITEFLNESTPFPSKLLHSFKNLERLEIKNCSFQEIFPHEGEGLVLDSEQVKHTYHTPLLPHLLELKLSQLYKLKHIWKDESPLIPILEKLVLLQVQDCIGLTDSVPHSVSFKFLIHLNVYSCGRLKNLIQSSTARSFEQLQRLKIGYCHMMEEIVAGDGDNSEDDEIIFSRLEYLLLSDMPRLTNFCTGNYNVKLPVLEKVTLQHCTKMRTFCGGITSTPKLEGVYSSWNEEKPKKHWNGDLNTTVQKLFSKMEDSRLITAVPSTSSNNHFEPEAQIHEKPIESAGEEIEHISEELSATRKDGQICENGIDELRNKPGNEAEVSENVIKPEKEIEVCENAIEPREGVETHENAIAPLDVAASSSQSSPASNQSEISPRKAASSSQQENFPGSRVTQDFIAILGKVIQILQTQPLNGMSVQQVQFMEDAFRDLSDMKFSIEWFSPFIEKARECISVAEQRKEMAELELKIAETKAQLQALEENKRALEEKYETFASSAIDLNKPLCGN